MIWVDLIGGEHKLLGTPPDWQASRLERNCVHGEAICSYPGQDALNINFAITNFVYVWVCVCLYVCLCVCGWMNEYVCVCVRTQHIPILYWLDNGRTVGAKMSPQLQMEPFKLLFTPWFSWPPDPWQVMLCTSVFVCVYTSECVIASTGIWNRCMLVCFVTCLPACDQNCNYNVPLSSAHITPPTDPSDSRAAPLSDFWWRWIACRRF